MELIDRYTTEIHFIYPIDSITPEAFLRIVKRHAVEPPLSAKTPTDLQNIPRVREVKESVLFVLHLRRFSSVKISVLSTCLIFKEYTEARKTLVTYMDPFVDEEPWYNATLYAVPPRYIAPYLEDPVL